MEIMIYFTSDLHFGHKNIMRYAERPFETTEEMDQALIDNWNTRVNANDEVYILGDVTMRGGEFANEKLSQLKGRIYLIKGNHDYYADRKNYDPWRLEWIKDYHVVHYQNEQFVLFHFPILEWDRKFHGAYQLHGHQHNHADYNIKNRADGIRRYDVGVDANNYAPVSIEEIMRFFADDTERTNLIGGSK